MRSFNGIQIYIERHPRGKPKYSIERPDSEGIGYICTSLAEAHKLMVEFKEEHGLELG